MVNEEDPGGGGGGDEGHAPADSVLDEEPIASRARAPGLWATVEWTAQAQQMLRARQYRYLSPVALVRKSDQRMVGLHSVALTNKPAIVGMQPIVASERGTAKTDEARPIAVLTPTDGIAGDNVHLVALRQVLHLADATPEAVLAAASQRIAALQNLIDARHAADRVEKAMAAGKLAPAQHEWARVLALRDPGEFDEWFSTAPVIVPLGRTQPPGDDAARLTDAVQRRARAEYRAHAATLSAFCTEDAFVADAVRARVP